MGWEENMHRSAIIAVGSALVVATAVPAIAERPAPVALQQNGWLIYDASHVAQTIPCTPQPILLRGSHTDTTLSGRCAYVRVAGGHNDIAIEIGGGATIEITGEHNDVSWHQVAPGPPPRLLAPGPDNTFHTWQG